MIDQKVNKNLLLFSLVIFYAFTLIKTAWLSDDIYITFRSVENLIHGYGPTYNVLERSQSFTHPLWMFIISFFYFIFVQILHFDIYGQLYYIVLGLSMLLSVITVFLLAYWVSPSVELSVFAVAILTLSQSFMDYSTSGLENPLSHLLLLLFSIVFFRLSNDAQKRPNDIFLLSLLGSLSALNRQDTFLLVGMPILWSWYSSENKRKAIKSVILGFLPLILWEVFSVFYYGFPIPNTAYAKLNTGIPWTRLLQQGIYYYLNSIGNDPITLFVIILALFAVLRIGNTAQKILGLSVFLYLVYVLRIGGDFMSGRFFVAPLLVSLILLLMLFKRVKSLSFSTWLIYIVIVLSVGLSGAYSPWFSRSDYGMQKPPEQWINDQGIANERAYYYHQTGLMRANRYKAFPDSAFSGVNWRFDSQKYRVKFIGPAGMTGYVFGPNVHVVDYNALADPLLSKLPVADTKYWRIGHFKRLVPEGYEETLQSHENLIEDENLALYYEKLALITRGPLWSWERLVTIVEFNLGLYDHYLDSYIAGLQK